MESYRVELEWDYRYVFPKATIYVGDDPLWLFRIYPRRQADHPVVASVYEMELRGKRRGQIKRLLDLDARGLSLMRLQWPDTSGEDYTPSKDYTPGEDYGWLLDLALEAGLDFPAMLMNE
jgi:hypothetical protein